MSMEYREYILDHYRNPRNYGTLEHPNAHAEDSNPLCGDQLAIDLQIEADRVTAVRFKGRGCAISQAAASMLTEELVGKTLEEVGQMTFEDVIEDLGKDVVSTRTRCATLALTIMKSASDRFLREHRHQ